jgi:hypothetical protein
MQFAAGAERTVSPALRLALLLSLLLALGLMLAAASGDLWLDEIWSVQLSRTLHSPSGVFTLRHDNNHPLNTLYLYWLGQPRLQLEYRLAAVLGGLACIGMAGLASWRNWGPRESLLCVLLCATSFPILLYSSEARGYGLLMCFALGAYLAWNRCMQRARWTTILAFWTACVLGVLAQFTFVVALFAFAIGQLAADREAGLAERISKLAGMHAVPLLFVAWWYRFFIGRLVLGGGDATDPLAVVGSASAVLLGLPDTTGLRALAFAGLSAVTALGVIRMRQAGDGQWLFFACVVVLAPAILLLASLDRIVQVRYFLVSFPFFLMLAARLLGEALRRHSRKTRALALLALAVYFAGNLQRDAFLILEGRGGYSKAIAYMLRETTQGPVLVSSDHDFRNGLVLAFHAPRQPGGDRVHYVSQAQASRVRPEWFLLHSQQIPYRPLPKISVSGVGVYELVRSYGYAGLSGWSWYLYRRTA